MVIKNSRKTNRILNLTVSSWSNHQRLLIVFHLVEVVGCHPQSAIRRSASFSCRFHSRLSSPLSLILHCGSLILIEPASCLTTRPLVLIHPKVIESFCASFGLAPSREQSIKELSTSSSPMNRITRISPVCRMSFILESL